LSYTLTAGPLAGYSASVSEPASRSIASCGKNLDFAITYTPGGECTGTGCPTDDPKNPQVGPTLTVEPPYQQVEQNRNAYFNAKYDPDGAGPQPKQDVSLASAWSSSNPSVAPFSGTANGAGRFSGITVGTTNITAAYAGLTAPAVLDVTNEPPAALSALLVPNPDQGVNPLNTVLTATAGGTAAGTINYTFWKDCNYPLTDIAGATARCGQPVAKFDNTNENPKSIPVTYQEVGNYTALVIVEREGYAAQAGALVVVRQNLGTPTPPPTSAHHLECVASACVRVNGNGVDRCGTAADCGGGTVPPSFGGVCDAVQHACVNAAGGTNSWSTDPACGGTTASHLECQNNSCVIVSGAGTNGSCSFIGQSCVAAPTGGPAACSRFDAAPKIISRGGSSILTWQCTGVTACTVTDTLTGAIVKSNGPSGSAPVSPAATTVYSLNCNAGTYFASTTVRVLTIDECNPGDPNCHK